MRGNIFYFYLFQFFLLLSVSLFLDVRYCWYCIALTERMNIGFTANNTNAVTTIPLLKKGGCFTHSTRFSCVPFGVSPFFALVLFSILPHISCLSFLSHSLTLPVRSSLALFRRLLCLHTICMHHSPIIISISYIVCVWS